MAISLVSPGVKITEVDQISSTPSLATTGGGFAGEFRWGPLNEPTLVVSEADLRSKFGSPSATSNSTIDFLSASNFLSYSQSLFVVRAANTAAALNATATKTTSDTANAGTGVLIQNSTSYDTTVPGSLDVGPWAAKYPGVLGNAIKVSTCPSSAAWESTLTGTLSVAVNGTVVTGSGTAFTTEVVVGDILILNSRSVQVKSVANGTSLTLESAHLTGATSEASVKRRWQYFDIFAAAPGTTPNAADKNAVDDEMHVVVVDGTGNLTGVKGNVLEKFASLSKGSDSKGENGGTNYYASVINSQSKYIWWADHDNASANWGNALENTTYTSVATPKTYNLAGGADGGNITDAARITAFTKLSDKEAYPLSVVIAGQASVAVVNTIIADVCEVRKDCVVTVSPTYASSVNNASPAAAVIAAFASLTRSTYAVADSGWKYQYDKYNDRYIYVPLNPDVAGCMARTDANREPWISPAGSSKGRILNSVKLAWNPNQTERDQLYKTAINPVITQAGIGTVLFGDKTYTTRNTAFNRINVRRLFIEIEKTIGLSAADLLFEQNDASTRENFVNLVSPYLRSVQARRGITAFKVVCDETNNPEDVVNNSEFICDIFVQPVKSVNFIQLNFVAVRGSASFSEVTA
jgi:hypothetical protein